MLLINKFRNKFSVNNITEPQIDRLIKDEVSALVLQNNMVETKLNVVDKKLEVMISDIRKNGANANGSQSNKSNIKTDK